MARGLLLRSPVRTRYQPALESAVTTDQAPTIGSDWRTGLPALTGNLVTLREMRASDAPALLAALANKQVSRFISPPPETIDGFERFIGWAIRQRQFGQYLCFAVVPHRSDTAIGIFQVRSLEPTFGTAEWGFALASEFWGTGLFVDGAKLVVDFAFDVLGVHRLEARAALTNGRGNGALRKSARSRTACCVSHSSGTASIWTRFSGRSCRTNGCSPRPPGLRASFTDLPRGPQRGPATRSHPGGN